MNKHQFALGFALFAAAILVLLFGDKTFPTGGAIAFAALGIVLMAISRTKASSQGH